MKIENHLDSVMSVHLHHFIKIISFLILLFSFIIII